MTKKTEGRKGALTNRAFLTYVKVHSRLGIEEAADPIKETVKAAMESVVTTHASIENSLKVLKEFTSKRDEEIARHRDGYDWKLVKHFVQRIIKLIDIVEDKARKHEPESAVALELSAVSSELVFLLECSDVTQQTPPLGEQIRDHAQYSEVIGTVPAGPSNPDGEIVAIEGRAYVLDPPEGPQRVVRPAQVLVAKDKDPKE